MAIIGQFRGDLRSNWESVNPVIHDREFILVKETADGPWTGYKIGDGVKTFNQLDYASNVSFLEILGASHTAGINQYGISNAALDDGIARVFCNGNFKSAYKLTHTATQGDTITLIESFFIIFGSVKYLEQRSAVAWITRGAEPKTWTIPLGSGLYVKKSVIEATDFNATIPDEAYVIRSVYNNGHDSDLLLLYGQWGDNHAGLLADIIWQDENLKSSAQLITINDYMTKRNPNLVGSVVDFKNSINFVLFDPTTYDAWRDGYINRTGNFIAHDEYVCTELLQIPVSSSSPDQPSFYLCNMGEGLTVAFYDTNSKFLCSTQTLTNGKDAGNFIPKNANFYVYMVRKRYLPGGSDYNTNPAYLKFFPGSDNYAANGINIQYPWLRLVEQNMFPVGGFNKFLMPKNIYGRGDANYGVDNNVLTGKLTQTGIVTRTGEEDNTGSYNYYSRTDYIEIPEGTTQVILSYLGGINACFYNESKVFISNWSTDEQFDGVFAIPAGAKYIRVNMPTALANSAYMYWDNNWNTSWFPWLRLRNENFQPDLMGEYVSPENLKGKQEVINVTDWVDILPPMQQWKEGYITQTGDVSLQIPGYMHSPKITTEGNRYYKCSFASGITIATYNAAGVFLTTYGNSSNVYDWEIMLPEGVAYIVYNLERKYFPGGAEADAHPAYLKKGVYTIGYKLPWLITPESNEALRGMRFTSFGDSITFQNKWQPFLVTKYSLAATNCGQGSTCLGIYDSDPLKARAMATDERINEVIASAPDIVCILGGANDIMRTETVGTDDDMVNMNKATFVGAYAYILDKLLTWKPTLRIILMTTTWAHGDGAELSRPLTYTQFAEATRKVAAYFGQPCADLHAECGFNKYVYSAYMPDHIHPNDAGGERIAEIVDKQMRIIKSV